MLYLSPSCSILRRLAHKCRCCSLAFNASSPQDLKKKKNTSLCACVFLLGRTQVVKINNHRQYRHPSGVCPLTTALLIIQQWLYFKSLRAQRSRPSSTVFWPWSIWIWSDSLNILIILWTVGNEIHRFFVILQWETLILNCCTYVFHRVVNPFPSLLQEG